MLQVFVGNVVFQEQTGQKERLVPKALLVSVGCLVSKEMLDLVVRRVSRGKQVLPVLKALRAHVDNVVMMVMMVPRVPQELKALLVETVPQVLVGNVVFQVQTVLKERLVLKALLVQRVLRVSKVLLAHAENVVTMVMMVQRVPQELKA